MLRAFAIIAGLMPALLLGCLNPETGPAPTHRNRLEPFQGDAARDVIVLDVALLELPVGDHYINRQLWDAAEEQVIAPERRGALEDNGLRIGQLGTSLPAELSNLVASRRSCPDPRRIQVHAGNTTTLSLGPTLSACQYRFHDDAKETPLTLEEADFSLAVTPTLTADGRMHLQFVPQVLHGKAALLPRPAADRSGWELQQQRPIERYLSLGWELTLGRGEAIAVGARYEHPDTLGHRALIRAEPKPTQRLLLIRASRLQPDAITGAADDVPSGPEPPTLARQASYTPPSR